jgi:hypothetical protein
LNFSLPANVLELDDVSAYDVAQANVRLAVEYTRGFAGPSAEKCPKRVAIMLPDETEARIALEKLTGLPHTMEEVKAGMTLSRLRWTGGGRRSPHQGVAVAVCV